MHIPFVLVAEILCRLSVKHLIQLRCVCKSWNSFISGDSNFAKKQLRLSTSNDDRHHVILSSPEVVLYHSSISSIFTLAHPTMIRYSLREILNKRKYTNGNITSTCDGIVCFQLNDFSAMLCNPSIRKFITLPPLKCLEQRFVLYTLVYDRFTNNYKIIALNSSTSRKEVNVHTLGTDYWRRIQDYPGPHLIIRSKWGTFVNDSVNWLTHDSFGCAQDIVSLNLEKETYQNLSLPVFDVHITPSNITILGKLKGCLSLLYRRGKFCDVWIMKEYGNEKSWTKLFTVPPKGCYSYRFTKALYISKDDQVLMEFKENGYFNWVIYDSINNTFKIPKFQKYAYTPEVYVESLISPF